MNKHIKSLGERSTNTTALNTVESHIISFNNRLGLLPKPDSSKVSSRLLGRRSLEELKETIIGIQAYLSNPTRRVTKPVRDFVQKAVLSYENAVKSSIGMPTYTDDVTRQREAPSDIPTLPLDGYQLIQRTCLVTKLATGGTAAGGFYAELRSGDLADFVKSVYFRVKMVRSWTATTVNAVGSGFAGVSVPVADNSGTEVLPMWSENWTPVGKGFAGVETSYPLGDFPLLSTTTSGLILTHYTSLGGSGGVTGVPVVFHVTIECLV